MMFHSTALLVVLMLAGCGALPQLAEPLQLSPRGAPDGEGAAAHQPVIHFRGDFNQRFAPFELDADDTFAAPGDNRARNRVIVEAGDDAHNAVPDISGVVVESDGVSQYGTVSVQFDNDIADGAPSAVAGALEQPEKESSGRQGRSGILTSLNFRQDGPQANARLTREVCGIRRNSVPDVFTRIVGGTIAEKHEFPWQASLQWRYSWYNYHVCGATILSASWILTAAHCTHQFKPSDIIIIAGVHNIKHKEGTEQKKDVDRVAEHWGYNTNTQENDIALVHVTTPFIIDGMTVSPVCLPAPGYFFQGDCVVSGWGKVSELGQSSEELRKVVVPIISREQCKEAYRVIGYSGPISEKMMCAGYSQGMKDACQGDSGGPFVCRGQDNRYTIAGVVSWGVGCARPNVPGVYTQVSRYTTWISSIVHGRTDATERRAASVHSSLHLNDFFNISVDSSDLDDTAIDGQRSDVGDESLLAATGPASLVTEASEALYQ